MVLFFWTSEENVFYVNRVRRYYVKINVLIKRQDCSGLNETLAICYEYRINLLKTQRTRSIRVCIRFTFCVCFLVRKIRCFTARRASRIGWKTTGKIRETRHRSLCPVDTSPSPGTSSSCRSSGLFVHANFLIFPVRPSSANTGNIRYLGRETMENLRDAVSVTRNERVTWTNVGQRRWTNNFRHWVKIIESDACSVLEKYSSLNVLSKYAFGTYRTE